MADYLREIATFLVGLVVLSGCGLLIFTSRGSEEQAWLMIGFVIAYYFNRQQQSSAVRDVINSQPNTTLTAGPPAQATMTYEDQPQKDPGPIPPEGRR
jgi:hypothetical protein